MNSTILDMICGAKRKRLAEKKKIFPFSKIMEAALSAERPTADVFKKNLRNPDRVSVIAELKKASPSAGVIREDFNPAETALEYREAGADAVSVLTEEDYFSGSPGFIRPVKSASGLPVLMKDFIIDEYQLYEALFSGADAVLLITGLLRPEELKGFIKKTAELGLVALVEVHGAEELETALSSGAAIIGINNRNLETFEVDIRTTLDVIHKIPSGIIKVSESGIKTAGDIALVYGAGADAVLVGEILMRSACPGEKLRELLEYA